MRKEAGVSSLRACMLLPLLLAASCAGPGRAERAAGEALQEGQGVKGTLSYQGRPLKGAYVYAYRSSSTNLLGPADFASAPSGADGTYTVELVEGAYHLVARRRASGENAGPIVAGDLYSVHSSNPVAVGEGRYTLVNLELTKLRDPMFFRSLSRTATDAGIRGRIVDAGGSPAPWVFAMAYTTADMKRIPDYTSVMTGEDGEFTVYLPGGGTYWLAARKSIREKPVPGEPYALYRGTPDHSIQVPDKGFVENVTLTLEPYYRGIHD